MDEEQELRLLREHYKWVRKFFSDWHIDGSPSCVGEPYQMIHQLDEKLCKLHRCMQEEASICKWCGKSPCACDPLTQEGMEEYRAEGYRSGYVDGFYKLSGLPMGIEGNTSSGKEEEKPERDG